MSKLEMKAPHGFQLSAASQFYAGFIPGSGMAAAAVDRLTLAFRLDGSFEPVAVELIQAGDCLLASYNVAGSATGTETELRLRKQLARILGLDVDGEAWLALGERDAVVGKLQAQFPGFFTAAKPSPYDAAAWGVLAPRMHIEAAARLKMSIAERCGDAVELSGRVHHIFPSPQQVLRIGEFPGLLEEKRLRLRAVAEAAMQGRLDADRLCALSEAEALEDLQTLRGVGPWTASHILYRGAAPKDALPTAEPRVLHAVAAAYGIALPSDQEYRELAEAWRPFRMWICILLMRNLMRAGGWHKSELRAQRARAGQKLRSSKRQGVLGAR